MKSAGALLRLRLSDALRRRLLGTVVGRVPQSILRSVAEHSLQPQLARHLGGIEAGDEATVERYAFPDDYSPAFRRAKAFDPLPLVTLNDVCVSPSSGLVWLPAGELLQESVGSLHGLLRHQFWFAEVMGPAAPLDSGRPVIVHPTTAYFHWLLETLPNILRLLQAVPDATILSAPAPPRYVREGLAHLQSLTGAAVVTAPAAVRVTQLLMRPREEFSGFVRAADRQAVRGAFQALLDAASPGGSGPLYISRSRTPRRSVENEAELEAALSAQGFHVVFAEELALCEQVSLFAGATSVVALHGAGLANLVWCRPGTAVVEVFPAGVFNDCYARLALAQGLSYTPLRLTTPEVPVAEVLAALQAREAGVQ